MAQIRSDGQWHLRVPKETRDNVRFRLWVLRYCRKHPEARKGVIEMCRRDILFWINTFVWQFNPNALGDDRHTWSKSVGPFVTADYQDDVVRTLIECVRERKDVVIEKSREMGASWLCLIVIFWYFLFHDDQQFICISRNEKAVDDVSKNSLFSKLDYILKRMPEWMADRGEGKIVRRQMSFINEANGSEIVGDATTKKATVGGRATAILIDEYAKIEQDFKILTHTASTSGCRIFASTHEGTNTAFYDLCRQSMEGSDHIRRIVLHWSQHPDKNAGLYHFARSVQRVIPADPDYVYPPDFKPVTDGSPTGGPFPGLRSPWYDEMCRHIGSARGIAADLDINPTGSSEQAFDPLMIADLQARYAIDPAEYTLRWFRDEARPDRFFPERGGPFKLWLPFLPDGRPPRAPYAFGADVATGLGTTPSCVSGMNARTGEKIFEYVDAKIEPRELAHLLVALGWAFVDEADRPAKLVWETPGPGNTVSKHVMALRYPNLHFRRTEHRLKKETSDVPGWPNSPDSMKQLIENYKDALKARLCLNRSYFALGECTAFVFLDDGYVYHTGWKDPKDPSAARHNHGDRVIADALAWKLVDEWGKLNTPGSVLPAYEPVRLPGMPPPGFDPRGLAGRRALSRVGWNPRS